MAGLTKTFTSLGLLINSTGIPVTIVSLIGCTSINASTFFGSKLTSLLGFNINQFPFTEATKSIKVSFSVKTNQTTFND